MKMIVAVIKPFKLDDVREALNAVGVEGLTVTEVRGFGRQRGRSEGDPVTAAPSFLPKLKIEIAIPDSLEDKAVKAIAKAANTGRIGDGKIFIYNLDGAIRIRTGETGEAAI
jgi:nitrogen regulatory protein P-II 2